MAESSWETDNATEPTPESIDSSSASEPSSANASGASASALRDRATAKRNEPRRHHTTPLFHLRGFAEDDQVVLVARDDLARSHRSSINNATVQKDFYTIETDDGPSQFIEQTLLGKIESASAPALARLALGTFPPSSADRVEIALFVAVLSARSEGRIERTAALIGDLVKQTSVNITPEAVRRFYSVVHGRVATDEEIAAHVEFLSDPAKYEIKVDKTRVLQRVFEQVADLIAPLHTRTWVLLRATDDTFLTSDAPITLWSPPPLRPFGVGMLTAMEIACPIDRRHALVLLNKANGGERCLDATPEMVKAINYRSASNARRWIIHHPDDTPLDGMSLPPRAEIKPLEAFRIVPPG